MGSGRVDQGRRGACRPVSATNALPPRLETQLRRRVVLSGLRDHLLNMIESNSQLETALAPPGLVHSTGRPMYELFGVQNLGECYF